jgi:hypothetical protein
MTADDGVQDDEYAFFSKVDELSEALHALIRGFVDDSADGYNIAVQAAEELFIGLLMSGYSRE